MKMPTVPQSNKKPNSAFVKCPHCDWCGHFGHFGLESHVTAMHTGLGSSKA